MLAPKTLTARVLLGFSLLVLVFGIVSVWTVIRLDNLTSAIGVVRAGYLELTVVSGELADRQDTLFSFVKEELPNARSVERMRSQINLHRLTREKKLKEAESRLKEFRETKEGSEHKYLIKAENYLQNIRLKVEESSDYASELLRSTSLGKLSNAEAADEEVEEARDLYKKLVRNERDVYRYAIDLREDLKLKIKRTMMELERISKRVRLFILLSGGLALLLGVLVTSASVLMLRPLNQLRDRVTKISEGDYSTKLNESGPREIADLAKEFNLMSLAILEREKELVKTERLATVGKMAAMITHEVRNPLSSIGLNAEILEEEFNDLNPSHETRVLLRSIGKEVDRLTEITDEYLKFSRLPKPKCAPESLSRLAKDVIGFEKDSLERKGISVKQDIDEQLVSVFFDEGQIRQVLINLIRNSADALVDSGGVISIWTQKKQDKAVFGIRDDGPGLPEDALGKIFEPFVSFKDQGTGLGLALSQQIVEEHGGKITASNHPMGGAVFEVSLPLSRTVQNVI